MSSTLAPPVQSSRWARLIATVVVAVAAVMPGFAATALAGPIEESLGLSGTAFGAAATCFFAFTALGSFGARRLVPRLPVRTVLGVTSLLAALCLVGLAVSTNWWMLAGFLALAGLGNCLSQPVAAQIIATDIAPARLSFASGLFGASLGAAPLVPGLLVTFVAAPHGWRPALWVGAALAFATLLSALFTSSPKKASARPEAAAAESARPNRKVGYVVIGWTVAAALATIGSNVCAAYFIQIGTGSGFSAAIAGTLQMLAAILGVAVRLGSGVLADRAPQHNPLVVAAMMATGAAGLAVITAGVQLSFLIGALLAVAGGWGWTGLLLAATLRLLPGQGARAGAAVQLGLFAGAAVGPLAFGALSTAFGIPTTLALAAAGPLIGALLVVAGILALRNTEENH